MDLIVVIPVLLLLALIALGLAAPHFGVDSRHRSGHDWW